MWGLLIRVLLYIVLVLGITLLCQEISVIFFDISAVSFVGRCIK
jgi:hypothetical protein